MASSEFSEGGTFCWTKLLSIGRLEAVASVLAHNQDLAIERELIPPPNQGKLGDILNKPVLLKRITDGDLGAELQLPEVMRVCGRSP